MNTRSLLSLPTPGSLPPEEELQRLRNLNDKITHLIPYLRRQGALVSDRVNALQSLTRNLAPETLAIIFEYACLTNRSALGTPSRDGFHPNHFQLTLAAVSSLWRQTVFSSPQLWTCISLRFNDWRLMGGRLCLLRLYLTRSGILKLDIHFSFDNGGSQIYRGSSQNPLPQPNVLIHTSVDYVILNNLNRIRSLRLVAASPNWFLHTSQLSQLTTFSFVCDTNSQNSNTLRTLPLASFSNCPHLQELCLSGILSIDLHHGPHWSTITILKLYLVELNTSLTLLALCTNLVEYHNRFPRRGTTPTSSLPWLKETTRPMLKVFQWDILSFADQAELRMLEHLHLPSLQTLQLAAHVDYGRQSSVRAFCSRLPSTLSAFRLAISCISTNSIEECILKSIPTNLQIQVMNICCLGCHATLSHTLTCLADPDFLPKLKQLRFLGPFVAPVRITAPPLQAPTYCGDLVLGMIWARAVGKHVDEFYLETTKISISWSAETLERLQRVAEETGLKLTFVEDGKTRVTWKGAVTTSTDR